MLLTQDQEMIRDAVRAYAQDCIAPRAAAWDRDHEFPREALAGFRVAFEKRGRDPATLHVVPMGVVPSREKLDYYASIGVTEAVLRLPSAPRDEVMPVLDAYAKFVSR